MHYIIEKRIKKDFQDCHSSMAQILQKHISYFSDIREHYIIIINLFNQQMENTETCLYDDVKTEISLIKIRMSLMGDILSFVDDDNLKTAYKEHKKQIDDLSFDVLLSKKDKNKMIIYDYPRYIQNMKKSKNFINSVIRSLKKRLYKIYN